MYYIVWGKDLHEGSVRILMITNEMQDIVEAIEENDVVTIERLDTDRLEFPYN